MNIFQATITVMALLALLVLTFLEGRFVELRRIHEKVDAAESARATQARREHRAETQFEADAIDTLESEGGLTRIF
jgi:hypothetical protein